MDAKIAQALRGLPSVDQLLSHTATAPLLEAYGHALTVEALQAALASARRAIRADNGDAPTPASLVEHAGVWLGDAIASSLVPIINATGIIIHTNLGRAPLSDAARAAIAAATAYSNLEFDLESGRRGSRTVHAARLIERVTGAESALVVNNTASAVLLMLTALCQGREVVISRGQLVEIGGGFRVPDVMAQSGAKLVEVGTTNRTHLRDYAAAMNENTGAILVAHHSNFKIIGFTTEPSLAELSGLAREHGVPLLYDQGSGALRDTAQYGVDAEPLVQDGIEAGADVVAFSGDKLLGGPQAGVLVGRRPVIDVLKRHPLARAVRPDKLCLAGLAATLDSYVRGRAEDDIPVWRMMAASVESLTAQAEAWATALRARGVEASVASDYSRVGGGSLPGQQLPTAVVVLRAADADALAHRLRHGAPRVVGRIRHGAVQLDPRTVQPDEQEGLLDAVTAAWHATVSGEEAQA